MEGTRPGAVCECVDVRDGGGACARATGGLTGEVEGHSLFGRLSLEEGVLFFFRFLSQ